MRSLSRLQIGALLAAFMFSVVVPASAENKVSGNLIVDGKTVPLKYAYMDEADASKPVTLSSVSYSFDMTFRVASGKNKP
jgi:hypothetical protein